MKTDKLVELANDFVGFELFDAIDFAINQMICGAIVGSAEMPDTITYDRLLLLRKALYEEGIANRVSII